MIHYIRQMDNGKWMEVMVENGDVVDWKEHESKPTYDQDMKLIYENKLN